AAVEHHIQARAIRGPEQPRNMPPIRNRRKVSMCRIRICADSHGRRVWQIRVVEEHVTAAVEWLGIDDAALCDSRLAVERAGINGMHARAIEIMQFWYARCIVKNPHCLAAAR